MTKRGSTLKEHIYNAVFDGIIKGEYLADDVLSEKFFVEKYHVSKSPVREALIELCNENVLRCIPRYGYEVVRLTEADVNNIQQYRLVLECGCLDRFWDKITPANIAQLRGMLGSGIEADALKHWASNRDFHLNLIALYNNEYLYRALESSLNTLTRAYAQFFWDKWHSTVFFTSSENHHHLIDAIERGDKASAIHYLQIDIGHFDEDASPRT